MNEDIVVYVPSHVTFNGTEYPVAVVFINAFAWMKDGQELKLPSTTEIIFSDWLEGKRKSALPILQLEHCMVTHYAAG